MYPTTSLRFDQSNARFRLSNQREIAIRQLAQAKFKVKQ